MGLREDDEWASCFLLPGTCVHEAVHMLSEILNNRIVWMVLNNGIFFGQVHL